jgi:deoxyribodipyrimidine photo-lyase
MSESSETVQIVWFRRDLRLADQTALHAAAAAGPIVPVFVLDDERAGDRKLGGASRWYLHGSLASLGSSLGRHRSQLILRKGDVVQELMAIARATGAKRIHAIRHYEPWWREAESELGGEIELCLHDGNYLMPPGSVTTGSGDPYKIYTPFAKALARELPARDVLEEPAISSPDSWPDSDSLDDWGLLPTKPDWAGGMRGFWTPGEAAAHDTLAGFKDRVSDYEEDRNLPSIDGSSRLSPHLHFGEISPVQVWDALSRYSGKGTDTYRGEVMWRDYTQNVIYQFPKYPEQSYRDTFGSNFRWRDPKQSKSAADDLEAWQQGMTGYPIVDAGMRQLWSLGWIHNRVRMIVASFLIKHLLIDWRHGERWFWDTLVDADYANNGVNWQWVSGSGVDSNMFPRIMAPLSQSEKFDAADYIREWVPELKNFPDAEIHDPDDRKRGDYPVKRIGHKEARERALEAYRKAKD